MNRKTIVAFVVILLLVVLKIGCGQPEDAVMPVSGEETEVDADWPSQVEVVSAIDEVIEAFNNGKYNEEEVIVALQDLIPKPEGYPARPVEYIVPWGEGGDSDNYACHIGFDDAKIMGQNIVYNNMPGSGGEVGLAYLLTQGPDGNNH